MSVAPTSTDAVETKNKITKRKLLIFNTLKRVTTDWRGPLFGENTEEEKIEKSDDKNLNIRFPPSRKFRRMGLPTQGLLLARLPILRQAQDSGNS